MTDLLQYLEVIDSVLYPFSFPVFHHPIATVMAQSYYPSSFFHTTKESLPPRKWHNDLSLLTPYMNRHDLLLLPFPKVGLEPDDRTVQQRPVQVASAAQARLAGRFVQPDWLTVQSAFEGHGTQNDLLISVLHGVSNQFISFSLRPGEMRSR